MNKVKILYSILLSLVLALKYKINTIKNFAFTSESLLVPLTASIIGYIFSKKDKKSEFLFFGMISNFIYYIQLFLRITGINASSTEFGLFFKSLIFVYSAIFKFFLTDIFNLKKMIFFAFCISFMSYNIFKNITIDDDVFNGFLKIIMGIQIEVVYITMVNVLCNEYGIFNFLKYSFFIPFFSLISSMFFINYKSLIIEFQMYKENIFLCLLYYLTSLLCFIGSIIFVQMYGIVCASIVIVNSLLYFMIFRCDKWYTSIIYLLFSVGMIIN